MAEAPTGDDLLTPDDAVNVLEELLEAQNQSYVLGLKLQLPQCEVDAIHSTYSQPRDRLLRVLIEFTKQVDPRPTWRAIVDALKNPVVNLPQLAMRVEGKHFPDPRNLLRETDGRSTENVKAEIEVFEKRFDTMKLSTIKCLEKIQVSVMAVVYIFTSLRAVYRGEQKMFLKKNIRKLNDCQNHWELFGSLNLHCCWNYLTYHLLDHLIKEVSRTYQILTDVNRQTVKRSLTDVKRQMSSYKKDLKKFRKRTPLEIFCQVYKGSVDDHDHPPGFREMVVKYNWPTTTTLEDVEIFRKHYVHHYNLRDCAMMLNRIRPGTFTVTWFVPLSVVELLKKRAPKVFIEFNVSRLEFPGVAGYCVYEEYLFVKPPSEDFFCPVMCDLLLQPHLTTCCGNHLSQAATRIHGKGGACPLCKEPHLTTVLDKHFLRQVNELHVFCRHKDRGCEWQGKLSDMEHHVQSCPMKSAPLMTDLLKLPVYGDEGVTSGTGQDRTRHQSPTPHTRNAQHLPLPLSAQQLYNHPELRPFILSNVTIIGTKIGHGAYGIVVEVEIPGAICAAKKIHSIYQEVLAPETLTQFVKECQLNSTLRHPNIVQFLGVCFFPDSPLPALVMERLLTDLHNFLDPEMGTPLPPNMPKPFFPLSLKCSILHDVASGLAYLHGHNPPVIHRDLSAKNILLTSGMVAKIADLGVARIMPQTRLAAMTKAPGTDTYMPPEAREADSKNQSKYNASIDIFSFGVVAIFILSQTFPYKLLAPNYRDYQGKNIARSELERRDRYVKMIKLWEGHPLLQMIEKCLKFAEDRPKIHEVLSQLEEVRDKEGDNKMEMNKLGLIQLLETKQEEIKFITKKLTIAEEQIQEMKSQETEKDKLVWELQQQLREQETELMWAKDRAQQQLKQRETERDRELAERDEIVQAKDRELAQAQQQLRQQEQSSRREIGDLKRQLQSRHLPVECQKKKRAPCVISRGSATTDDQFAYFTTQGSRSVYAYEWSTENWKEFPSIPYRYSGLVIIDGKLTAVGGRSESGCTNKLVTLQEGQWIEHYPPMNTARSQTAIVSTSDGNYIFVIGGAIDRWIATVELFHVRSRRWYELTNLPKPLTIPSATICGNQLCVIGGKDNGYSCSLDALPSSDPPTSPPSISWKLLPRLPVILSTAATLRGHLLIIGGDQSEDQSRISKFLSVDPDVDTIYQLVGEQWEKIGAMSVTRSECLVVNSSPDELLIVGGVDERGVDICFLQNR